MTVEVRVGDSRELLRAVPDESIHCCVTSPPYFGLRDYGVDGQMGLEQTPDEYVQGMVELFREVRRVLRDDGTVWLNLGDSYSIQHVGRRDHGTGVATSRLGPNKDGLPGGTQIKANGNRLVPGLKPKDLIGIPWRVAFALQADGWYLRQDIIWAKPNPMPESVKDRCTKAHEYIFMLSKSARYFFDHEAIKEPASGTSGFAKQRRAGKVSGRIYAHENADPKGGGVRGTGNLATYSDGETRNRRSVWTVATKPFKGAHFATFPPDLIEPCILAGCPADGTVLDPFGGSGTTGMVASWNNRNAVLLELNPEYAEMARARVDTPRPTAKVKRTPSPAPANDNDLFGVAA